jgi:hypothetical protein
MNSEAVCNISFEVTLQGSGWKVELLLLKRDCMVSQHREVHGLDGRFQGRLLVAS